MGQFTDRTCRDLLHADFAAFMNENVWHGDMLVWIGTFRIPAVTTIGLDR